MISRGKKIPSPLSPSVGEAAWVGGLGMGCDFSCSGGRLAFARGAAAWPSAPSLLSSDVAATGAPAAEPAPPAAPPPGPPLSTELLPPPFGASSKYWSPSVDPGGTVIFAVATAGTESHT